MISSEIFPTDGSNFSDYFFYNGTDIENGFLISSLTDIIIILLGLPTNSYVIWLIVTGTGNGLAAEFFSLNLSICEILFSMESHFNLISYKTEHFWIGGFFFYLLAITGHPLFQCLMCVERYLAVVHPVTFLMYKSLRYKVICCVIAWVADFVFSGISIMALNLCQTDLLYYIFIMTYFSLFLSIQLFCLVAVLRALKQSGPGERGRERGEKNHMKRRAFYIILITAVSMLIIFLPYMILSSLSLSVHNGKIVKSIGFVCYVLAGLVQPVLFLYRVGKLPFIKCQ